MAKKKMNSTRRKISLAEGFLDGEEDVVNTPETAPVEEEPKDVPAEDEEENDLSDEPDVSDLDDDDEKDSNEEAGVAEEKPEEEENLQDTLQTLITAVQGLTDQIAKQNGEGDNADGSAEEVPAEAGSDEPAPDAGSEETAEPAEDDSDYEGDDTTTDDTGDESNDGDGEASDDEDADADETKNETIRQFFKPGQILHENSSTLIGKLAHYRYDKIEPLIMAIVKSKIERRIEGAKSELRQAELARRLNQYESTEK